MIKYQGIEIDRKTRTISHRGACRQFGRQKNGTEFELFCHLILAGGLTRGDLFDRLYDNREDGGPDQGMLSLYVRERQFRDKFDALGLKLVKDRVAGLQRLRLVPA